MARLTHFEQMVTITKVLWSCHDMWNGKQMMGSGAKEKNDPAAIEAVGYKLLNDYFDGYQAEWKEFSQQWGMKIMVLMRKECLDHWISIEHWHQYSLIHCNSDKCANSTTGKLTEINILKMKAFCTKRNDFYAKAMSTLNDKALHRFVYYAEHKYRVVTDAGLSADDDDVMQDVRQFLGVADPAKLHTNLRILHTDHVMDYVANKQEVGRANVAQWDYYPRPKP